MFSLFYFLFTTVMSVILEIWIRNKWTPLLKKTLRRLIVWIRKEKYSGLLDFEYGEVVKDTRWNFLFDFLLFKRVDFSAKSNHWYEEKL